VLQPLDALVGTLGTRPRKLGAERGITMATGPARGEGRSEVIQGPCSSRAISGWNSGDGRREVLKGRQGVLRAAARVSGRQRRQQLRTRHQHDGSGDEAVENS
jgi:hypothetical protein